jgi:hypothetical protein
VDTQRFDTNNSDTNYIKFRPDDLFTNIAHTCNTSDIFCIKQMQAVYQKYSSCTYLKAEDMWDYKDCFIKSEVEKITQFQHFMFERKAQQTATKKWKSKYKASRYKIALQSITIPTTNQYITSGNKQHCTTWNFKFYH